MNTTQLLYGTGILLTGLVAGLFYGYQCSVNNGLGALGDKEYLLGFQSINNAIQNPLFFLSFIGNIIILPIATICVYRNGGGGLFPYLLTATAIYVIAVFGITIICNVPLNELLARFDIRGASDHQLDEMRKQFEVSWNRWHLVRTVASIIAFIILLIPLLKR